MTADAPSGVVTFLFTDIEGSTRRSDADVMRAALVTHDEVLRTAMEEHEGFCSATPVMAGSLARERDGVPLRTWW